MGKKHVTMCLTVTVTLLFLVSLPLQLHSMAVEEGKWYVRDVIDLSLDEVKWLEEGGTDETPAWITDGTWSMASIRQNLINTDDIFVSCYEVFNWTQLQLKYELPFSSFSDLALNLTMDPSWWLHFSWNIDTEWYGVPLEQTKVNSSFDETSSEAELRIWFHITRIAEYFVGEERLKNWLTGFDLTPISIGGLKAWEFYEDSAQSGEYYSLYFKAPANLLAQHGENFTFTIDISASYWDSTLGIDQIIEINMPADTEIKEASPSNFALTKGNTATFVMSSDDVYPQSFVVVSGSPTKSVNQLVWENASAWLFTPAGWAAIATLTVLSMTALRGRRIWNRNKLYNRLYKGMITVYDLYSGDLLKFQQEIDSYSKSMIKYLIEDRITDEQFDRLLMRRDDLLQRVSSGPSTHKSG